MMKGKLMVFGSEKLAEHQPFQMHINSLILHQFLGLAFKS